MSVESNIKGHVAIVTGASSGIGMATSIALAGRGVKVVLAARRTERLRDVAAQIKRAGGTAVAIRGDVSNRKQVQAMVATNASASGGIRFCGRT